ncbi:MAG: phage holin family protein [Thermodesulfobacteriota bacterium]|nr:phage holin family protein [Thermodesulfobacteriota bacterium]
MRFLLRWLILTVSIISASYFLEGIRVEDFFSAFFAAALLGLLNVFFRPVLIILTLPINILSLGLFTFIINALLLKMVSGVVSGFDVIGFWAAVFGSLIISIISGLLNSFVKSGDSIHIKTYTKHEGNKSKGNYIDLEEKDDSKWE